ncbi:MAG: orotate phosphoribosyltransferase [Candidatus Symbiodolus clandestinus]
MKNYQQQFIERAIQRQVLLFGKFTLKSGRQSPYFFNSGCFDNGADLSLLGRCYAATLMGSGVEFDQLFGPAYKGIPLVSATAIALDTYHQHQVPYSFDRKERKDHGEQGWLIGAPLTGKVVLIDDVISAGTAVHQAVPLITEQGGSIAAILIALDRQERGRSQQSALQEIAHQYDCPVLSIVTLNHLIDYLATQPALTHTLPLIEAYQQQYGAY